jgi:hypothetical protein
MKNHFKSIAFTALMLASIASMWGAQESVAGK